MVEVLEELQPGDGTSFPKTGDKVVVHYTGSLRSNGKVFDCSRERGHAFTFPVGVGKVIKGWDEGVSQLSKGQRVKLLIPYADAYGDKGQPPHIPPRADLIFDVELLVINETLVQESVRYRKEEQARAERFLKQRDDEAAAAAAAAAKPDAKKKKKKREREESSDSSDSDSSESSSEARKRRKRERKEKRKEKKEKKARHLPPRHVHIQRTPLPSPHIYRKRRRRRRRKRRRRSIRGEARLRTEKEHK